MSDMYFREPNQVKWMGSRPGHNGTQVLEYSNSAVLNWVPIYTVPAGETFYMTFMSFTWQLSVNDIWAVAIYNAVPAVWRYICLGRGVLTAGSLGWHESFWPPIEIPDGYHIYRYQAVNIAPCLCIHGWVE